MLRSGLALLVVAYFATAQTNLSAFHRNGQTYLTWTEDTLLQGESYEIARSTSGAQGPFDKIGMVTKSSAWLAEMHNLDSVPLALIDSFPPNRSAYVSRAALATSDTAAAQELPITTGLFVFTSSSVSAHQAWYRIRVIGRTGHNGAPVVTPAVTEQKAPPGAHRYARGPTRDHYLMYLDWGSSSSNRLGPAFPFALTRSSFEGAGALPVLYLDGFGTTPMNSYDPSNYGAGDIAFAGLPTWYFGFHARSAWGGSDGATRPDTIVNFIQHRIISSVLFAANRYGIAPADLRVRGYSMGASGALGMLCAYPSLVCAVWASQGVTDFADLSGAPISALWERSAHNNYGAPALHNPVQFLPFDRPDLPQLDWAGKHTGQDIYTIRSTAQFMQQHPATSFGYLCAAHTTQDSSISFSTQGAPFERWIRTSRQSFSYAVSAGGHDSALAIGPGPMFNRVSNSESRPGFSTVPPITGCDPQNPSLNLPLSRTYGAYIEWGTSAYPLPGNYRIQESDSSWVLPLRNTPPCPAADTPFTLEITPRNLQVLKVCPLDQFKFRIESPPQTLVSQGHIYADSLGLLLIPAVPINSTVTLLTLTLVSRGEHFPCQGPPAMGLAPKSSSRPTPGPILRARIVNFCLIVQIESAATIAARAPRGVLYTASGRKIDLGAPSTINGYQYTLPSGLAPGILLLVLPEIPGAISRVIVPGKR